MPANVKNIIKRTFNQNNPPPLSEEQKRRLAAVAGISDEKIDYSDAPFLPNAVWAKVGKIPPAKTQITLRIDADIVDFFRHTGKRYQTRINAVLRGYVDTQNTNSQLDLPLSH